jgi:ankyrin repeat protein
LQAPATSIADELIADILLAEQEARDDALLLSTAPNYGQIEEVDFASRQQVIRELVVEGADVNVVNKKNGNTPLCNAVIRNETALVDCLIQLGATIESDARGNERHVAPFHLASWSNRTDMMKHLIERGADIHHLDPTGANALFYASASGALEAMEMLFGLGLTPKHLDSQGRSALCRIVMEDDVAPQTIQKLLVMHKDQSEMEGDIQLAMACLDDPQRDRQNRYMEAARYRTRGVLQDAWEQGLPITV